MTFSWAKWPFFLGAFYSGLIALAGYFFNFHISLPWQPIGAIGVAVAFYLGFKNNSSYDRIWEARKIYGNIVNQSRSFGVGISSFVQGKDEDKIKKELLYRHVAWLTALRFQLRLSQPWENIEERINSDKYPHTPSVSENCIKGLDKELSKYLSDEEVASYRGQANVATQILNTQSRRLQELKDGGYFETFRHMQLYERIVALYDYQGMAERIKTFPLPRQYASTAYHLTLVFSIAVPFGLYEVFRNLDGLELWLYPFLSGLIIWIFFLMEKVGEYSENPFEGTYNDVPITSISRAIEIDLREMINDSDIPEPTKDENGFLM